MASRIKKNLLDFFEGELPEPPLVIRLAKAADLSPRDLSKFLGFSDAAVSYWFLSRRNISPEITILITWSSFLALNEIKAFYAQSGIEKIVQDHAAKQKTQLHPNWRASINQKIAEADRLIALQLEENKTFKSSDFLRAFERWVELGHLKDPLQIDRIRRYLIENNESRLAAMNELVHSGDLKDETEAKAREQLSQNGIEAMLSKKKSPKKQSSKKSVG
jgi:hypothetical protein